MNNLNNNPINSSVTIRYVKPIVFKLLFNMIKELIRDITFSINSEGITSSYYDTNNHIYCIIQLSADKFDQYKFKGEAFEISFNTINLVKIFKGVSVKDEGIEFHITPTSFTVQIDGRFTQLIADIDLIQPISHYVTLPDYINYPIILSIDSRDFQSTISQLKIMCHTIPRMQNIEIMYYANELTYTILHNLYGSSVKIVKRIEEIKQENERSECVLTSERVLTSEQSEANEHSERVAQLTHSSLEQVEQCVQGESERVLTSEQSERVTQPAQSSQTIPKKSATSHSINTAKVKTDDIYAFVLNLQFLVNLTKTTNMTQNIYMYINNNTPIFFEYMIGTLGKLIIGINPVEEIADDE